MSGCGARTAAGSLEAVFESSDVERFGWILMEVLSAKPRKQRCSFQSCGLEPCGWMPFSGLPDGPFRWGIVLVEFALQTPLNGPLAGQTTGTVNPGVIWVDRYLQVGVEAIVPINARSGRDIGVRAQAHLYLSEIFPDTIGKPIFGN